LHDEVHGRAGLTDPQRPTGAPEPAAALLVPDAGPVPGDAELTALLDAYAPLTRVPLCPELRAHTARSLVEIWEAAERLAGRVLPAPFWAYPWAGGAALARVILDQPDRVRGRRVLDLGCGGGVASLASALAGGKVVANDIDPWALAVTGLAAQRQALELETRLHDFTQDPAAIEDFDVVLCSELAYDRGAAPLQRAVLELAARAGMTVLVADSGRTYFDATNLVVLATFELDVPRDLEGVGRRTAVVYRY
jgi:predicted nicotinamide N-methyase